MFSLLSVTLSLLAVLVAFIFYTSTSTSMPKLDVKNKFCYVPGGSAGLGKALAEELVRRGAHVVIVARDAQRAAATIAGMKALVPEHEREDRKIFAVSADLTKRETSDAALEHACESFGGRAPDYTFLCAGFSKPQMFVDATPQDLQSGLDGVYWVSAWTAHAVTKLMVSQRATGTIVFVSSFLGYTTFAGYSPYSPGKYALRGLADSLRSELAIYGINVHLYMPAGILSPGYEVEQRTKPQITKDIEEDDTPITPEKAAALLIRGMEKGNYQITNDLVTELVRCSAAGPVPGNGPLDLVYWLIGAIGLPVWRIMTEKRILKARPAVYKDLEAKGFFKDPAGK